MASTHLRHLFFAGKSVLLVGLPNTGKTCFWMQVCGCCARTPVTSLRCQQWYTAASASSVSFRHPFPERSFFGAFDLPRQMMTGEFPGTHTSMKENIGEIPSNLTPSKFKGKKIPLVDLPGHSRLRPLLDQVMSNELAQHVHNSRVAAWACAKVVCCSAEANRGAGNHLFHRQSRFHADDIVVCRVCSPSTVQFCRYRS